MTRYTLFLPILRLILGIFGLFQIHEEPWGPTTNIFYIIYIVPVVIYLFHANWGLTHLDCSGYTYNTMYPVIAHLEANFRAFWPF